MAMSASKSTKKRNVIVIGAGIAGIAAARKLYKDDRFDVQILEASNRTGGRIFTSAIDGVPVELGATYIHGTVGNVIYELSNQYGLAAGSSSGLDNDSSTEFVSEFVGASVLLSNGESVPNEIVMKCEKKFSTLLEDMYTSVNAPKWASMYEDMNAYLVSEYPKCLENDPNTRDVLEAPYSNSIFEFFLHMQSVFEGQEDCKGVVIQADYVNLGGDLAARYKNGHSYGDLINKLIEDFPKDAIRYGREVVNVNTESDPIVIKCRNGDQFEADHVIITVSLGVLKRRCLDENLLPHECSLFTPTLPVEKQEAIRKLGFGHVAKIWLQFDQEIYKHNSETTMMLWLPEDKNDPIIQEKFPWAAGLYILYNPTDTNLYETWMHGSAVACVENTTKEEIKNGISYVFGKFLKRPIPKPVDVYMHKWLTDPLFEGCYTTDMISADTSASMATLAEPLGKNQVLFAGEATHIEFTSSVHGAYLSGVREADRLLETLCV